MTVAAAPTPQAALAGALIGGAIGDALGLPYENLSARRGTRLLGPPDRYRFVLGRGMVSDDTEHAALVVAALARSGGEVSAFERELALGLRWWVLGLPAGVGWATLRACLKLLIGVPPSRSGVYSAGNGPAMRAAVLGAAADDLEQLCGWVRVSTRLTHTDPKAEYAALAVAFAASQRCPAPDGRAVLAQLRERLPPDQSAGELLELLEQANQHAEAGGSTQAYAASLGLERGVSGYAYHTVPVAWHAWLRHGPDYAAAVKAAIACGGDTDTTGAIVGGMVGAGVGLAGLPHPWRAGLLEPLLSATALERLSERAVRALASAEANRGGFGLTWLRFPRNLVFLLMVLVHIVRRGLPPY